MSAESLGIAVAGVLVLAAFVIVLRGAVKRDLEDQDREAKR